MVLHLAHFARFLDDISILVYFDSPRYSFDYFPLPSSPPALVGVSIFLLLFKDRGCGHYGAPLAGSQIFSWS
jgi:hypothetical protein